MPCCVYIHRSSRWSRSRGAGPPGQLPHRFTLVASLHPGDARPATRYVLLPRSRAYGHAPRRREEVGELRRCSSVEERHHSGAARTVRRSPARCRPRRARRGVNHGPGRIWSPAMQLGLLATTPPRSVSAPRAALGARERVQLNTASYGGTLAAVRPSSAFSMQQPNSVAVADRRHYFAAENQKQYMASTARPAASEPARPSLSARKRVMAY